MHEACYDSISSGALHAMVNGSLLSQHIYESNVSEHASVAYSVLQLSLTPGNKVNQKPLNFFFFNLRPSSEVVLLPCRTEFRN